MLNKSTQKQELLTTIPYHIPVLLKECCEFLVVNSSGTYVDATLGGGGHTKYLLSMVNDEGKVISFDADSNAIQRSNLLLADFIANGKSILVEQNFSSIADYCKENTIALDGVLFDLGISSFQIDYPFTGLSYRLEAPLDMRFSNMQELSAEDVLATFTEQEIADMLWEYGEEPQSKAIAAKIVQRRKLSKLTTTGDLRRVVEEVVGTGKYLPTVLSRIFQAIRIEVNDEMRVLEKTITALPSVLSSKARIVVLTYHSLEDRIIKQLFQSFKEQNLGTIVTKKPIVPSNEELRTNPRARSAKLRVFEMK
ncbi:MAG: 16S rRNA (cytosine(1402)-N(4))-methyltransferase RsmH [Candidatus Kapabacteria bacterium]|nr:16S rRNA (cytosine(1402)-N(4))-methyltransferase RsmH [Candidatus Kapabacteria bacterium]